jgi:fatty-acyl-CoA synthase
MLSLSSRSNFQTLLDARVLQANVGLQDAIIYVETGKDPVHVSQKEFRQIALRYAAAICSLGILPGDLIIIAHTQNLESIYTFWGAMLAGAIPSMFPTLTEKLNPDVYMGNMAELVKISGARAVLTTNEFETILNEHVGCPVYSSARVRQEIVDAEHLLPALPDPEKVAFLQHSSGTTGLQKGVALSHRAVLNQLASYSDAIALDQQDVIVSWLPLYHDMGLIAGFILPLVQGIPLVLMSPFDWVRHPALMLRAINDYQGTLCWLPNFAYNHCARRIRKQDSDGLSLTSMRMFINCSEPVRSDSHTLFQERFAKHGVSSDVLAVSYAMAENTFGVTQTRPGESARHDIIDRQELEENKLAVPVEISHPQAVNKMSCGIPIEGTAVTVYGDNGRELPERHVGEIAIKSDCMLSGYYARPDLNPFQDGWFFTGDQGYIAEGEVFVIGRTKDLIINAGKNVYPQDIEAIVNQVPGVHAGRAVVFGVPDEREGTELIAVVAEVKNEDPDFRKQIAKRIRLEVGQRSMVTVSYVQLVEEKWLIKTSSGKIARAANRDKWLRQRRFEH